MFSMYIILFIKIVHIFFYPLYHKLIINSHYFLLNNILETESCAGRS